MKRTVLIRDGDRVVPKLVDIVADPEPRPPPRSCLEYGCRPGSQSQSECVRCGRPIEKEDG